VALVYPPCAQRPLIGAGLLSDDGVMESSEKHVDRIKVAEQQFRLACTVHLAVTNERQPLDVPVEWSFGKHRVSYQDFGLRVDQAPLAAAALEHTATLVLVSVIRDAIVECIPNPRDSADPQVVAAYQISRIIRNAFAHSMVDPIWSIDADCTDKTFEIDGVLSLNTTGLNESRLDWRHYGGPLAIFRLGRFVREVLLKSPIDPTRELPACPSTTSYQMGRLVLRKVDQLPPDAVKVARAGPGETVKLGGGYEIVVRSNEVESG
jgi:hypothetical protein